VRLLALLLGGCAPLPMPEPGEAARLRASIEPFLPGYRQAIAAENRLCADTLAWLRGSAIAAPRTQAVSEARVLTDRWARVYFVPRWMHGNLHLHEYSSPPVKAVQTRVLQHLRRRYFEFHDFQRYAQQAPETVMHHTPAGRLPAQLQEFQLRLEARHAAAAELDAMLAALPTESPANRPRLPAAR